MDNQEREEFDELQAQVHVWNQIFSYMNSLALKCAVQLGIPDVVHSHGKPMTLTELGAAVSIHPTKITCLHRLMRLLVHSGFFKKQKLEEEREEGEKDGFVLTSASRILVKEHPNSLVPYLLMVLDPCLVNPWHHMSTWFGDTEPTPFEAAHGTSFWNYGDQHPDRNRLFNEAMASDSRLVSKILVREYAEVFHGLRSLVDVGGGTGTVAMAIAQAFPHIKCTVLDLPHVVSNLPENLKSTAAFVGGDMFQFIPKADAVFLKWILHNWSHEDCVKILKRCKEAIPSRGGKVIIFDIVVNTTDDHKSIETQLFMDMQMMTVVGGMERNEKEWKNLFSCAGFINYKMTHVIGFRSVIEVYP